MACVTACPSGVQYDRLLEATRPQVERSGRARQGRQAVPRRDLRAVPVQAAAARGRRCRAGSTRRCGRSRRPGAGRAAAGQARGDGVAAAAGLRARRVRPPARAHPGRRARAAAGSRCSPAACRTCSSTASTRPPCGCSPPRAGTCSCPATSSAAARWSSTPAARSPRWPGPGARSASLRPRRRLRRHQRGGLRLVDEGVRPPARRRRRVGRPARGVQRAGARRARGAGRARAARARAPGTRPRRLPRRLPPRARQKVRAQPRAVLRSIPDLELLDLPEAELCCGSAGIYNMVAPEAAGELGARKAENIAADPARTSSSPPTRAACCRSASTSASTCRCCTRCSCSTRASAGCPFPVPSAAPTDVCRVLARPGGASRRCRPREDARYELRAAPCEAPPGSPRQRLRPPH